ncbi:MAG: hypothetical protein E6I77_09145 [Chloroflexi bacterium]|nr:MAG: hypothetical protein E6I77_09145 [Chloroflexota bacterium]
MRVHLMGIGGAGVSALARVYLARGDEVSGCDSQSSDTTAELEDAGVTIEVGHDPEHVLGKDLLVYSGAIKDSPELARRASTRRCSSATAATRARAARSGSSPRSTSPTARCSSITPSARSSPTSSSTTLTISRTSRRCRRCSPSSSASCRPTASPCCAPTMLARAR